MKRTIIVAIVISLLLVILPVSLALAQTDTDVVLVTATPGAVSISTSGYGFGSVAVSTLPSTSASPLTITNDSSLVIDISIGCDGWTGGATPWTYGAAGVNTALLNASASDSDIGGGSQGIGLFDIEVPDTTLPASPALLIDDLAVGTSPTWNLQLEAPTSFSGVDEQTTNVTLTTVVGG